MLYLGLVTVVGGIGYLLYDRFRREKMKKEEYCEALRLLLYLRGALSVSGGTLDVAMRGFERRGEALSALVAAIESDNGEKDGTRCTFFRDNLSPVTTRLEAEDESALVDFFKDFGKSTLGEEMNRLASVVAHFEKREKEIASEVQKDIKLSFVLFAFGITSAILLLL